MLELSSLSSLPHHCLVLTLDTLTILIDASTKDGKLPVNLPSQIDFILLCHSTPNHINALPRIALTHPHTQIYSTVPVANLGRLSTLETTPTGPTVTDTPVKSEEDGNEYEYLTHQDVDRVFDRITTLRYSQPTILSHGITITAYPAGHTIGGTIWNIRKDQENIVVMMDWNHAKERIVAGMLDTKTLRLLERASTVITDVRGSALKVFHTRKVREQFLIDSITSALTSGQSVLIPAPPPTRTLDLLLLLDNTFTTTPSLQKFPVFYLSHTVTRAITTTKTMLEWLSQDLTSQEKPLDFKYISIISSYSDLLSIPPGPRLVIVDGAEIQPGSFAYQAFLDFKATGQLLLFPTNSVPQDSIAGRLLAQWNESSPELITATPRAIIGVKTTLSITHIDRIPLQSEDLLQWRRADKLSRDKKAAEIFYQQHLADDAAASDSDTEDDPLLNEFLDVEDRESRVRGSGILLAEGNYDYWRGEPIRASFRSFPFLERRKLGDEFGWFIKPEEFIKLEDESKPVVIPAGKDGGVGKKRKWVEIEREEEMGEGPAREVTREMQVDVDVRVGYVDLEGLHDGRAVGNLLPRFNARKLVVVGSSREDVAAFKEMWSDIPRVTKEVYAPEVNETIDISVDTRQYEIRLSEDIAKTIKWQTVGNQQIAHIIGSITAQQPTEQNGTPIPSDSQVVVKNLPTLTFLSNTTSSSIPPARPLHVGEVRLLELKQRLQKAGYNTVLGEGVLICDGTVRVFKEEGGRGVRIEGAIGVEGSRKTYWDVRKAVYEGLAIV